MGKENSFSPNPEPPFLILLQAAAGMVGAITVTTVALALKVGRFFFGAILLGDIFDQIVWRPSHLSGAPNRGPFRATHALDLLSCIPCPSSPAVGPAAANWRLGGGRRRRRRRRRPAARPAAAGAAVVRHHDGGQPHGKCPLFFSFLIELVFHVAASSRSALTPLSPLSFYRRRRCCASGGWTWRSRLPAFRRGPSLAGMRGMSETSSKLASSLRFPRATSDSTSSAPSCLQREDGEAVVTALGLCPQLKGD